MTRSFVCGLGDEEQGLQRVVNIMLVAGGPRNSILNARTRSSAGSHCGMLRESSRKLHRQLGGNCILNHRRVITAASGNVPI